MECEDETISTDPNDYIDPDEEYDRMVDEEMERQAECRPSKREGEIDGIGIPERIKYEMEQEQDSLGCNPPHFLNTGRRVY